MSSTIVADRADMATNARAVTGRPLPDYWCCNGRIGRVIDWDAKVVGGGICQEVGRRKYRVGCFFWWKDCGLKCEGNGNDVWAHLPINLTLGALICTQVLITTLPFYSTPGFLLIFYNDAVMENKIGDHAGLRLIPTI